jgi:hypothetical protein
VSACTRFEDEGLWRLERGEHLDDHYATCADCARAREAYDRLRQALGESGRSVEPGAGWQDRVRARLGERRRLSYSRPVIAAAALATAAALVVVLRPLVTTRLPTLAPYLGARVESNLGEVRRGLSAQEGDRLLLTGTIDGSRLAELRVYADDRRLVLRCSTEEPCRRVGARLDAAVVLRRRGTYQPVLLTADHALPAPADDFDRDMETALNAGAQVALGPEIEVR